MKIHLTLGEVTSDYDVSNYGIFHYDPKFLIALNISQKSCFHYNFTYLSDSENNKIEFNEMKFIEKNSLKDGEYYLVNCEDNRTETLESLTENEIEQLKKEFKNYDTNNDQKVTLDEIEKFLDIEELKEIEELTGKLDLAMKNSKTEKEKEKWEERKKMLIESIKAERIDGVEILNQMDFDKNGSISEKEYFLARAPKIIRTRKFSFKKK
eukprot:gene3478-6127_t